MPVYSMTGYASAQHSTAAVTESENKPPPGQLGLEIRSVNSRFLDLSFRLPEDLRQYEPALRDLLLGKLKRGKVEVRASIEMGAAIPLSVADVIRLSSAEQSGTRDWGACVLPLADKTLKALLDARQREGARLSGMLLDHIAQLRTLAQQAVPLIPQLVEQNRQKFLARWKDDLARRVGSANPKRRRDRKTTGLFDTGVTPRGQYAGLQVGCAGTYAYLGGHESTD